ncbi:DUF1758 domain-containing protein [Trichonephila clavipes]|nr:DUF1758 domain-containing protein [Trichonephila clavipes]
MPISNDSYEEAWQKLLDRYDNKQILQSLIKTFLDQKPISEANCFNLRKLLDTSDECLRGFKALGKLVQPDLFTILVKFRLNEIAFTADIQQMYRQILIDEKDQNFQRIVWRESNDSPIREYKLYTVT